ncbi:MAG: radical SAM protein [Flavobacteriales bacterium]
MSVKTLLITPPFTQLNTPYPATAYLKGFLDSKDLDTVQYDLSIGLFNKVFTSDFISRVFLEADEFGNDNFPLVGKQRIHYVERVDVVTSFLRNQSLETAKQLLVEDFLPKAHRRELALDIAYFELDEIDKAKHLGTLFIEEIGDFITANVDEFFSFTRYAEQIATSASSFDQLVEYLSYTTTLIEDQLLLLLVNKIEEEQPHLICFTIPFPGNLFAALRCAQFIKKNYKHIKVAFGGGYCNTELRSLSDPRIFKYIDYITLDDGEGPLYRLIQHLNKEIDESQLERTFLLKKKHVVYQNKTPNTIFHHKDLPAPSYNGIEFSSYMSFLDVINPMHRLWTDGRWNKLTVSHGCYWKQCSFCDVNLDYIGNYQNTTAAKLVDRIEKVMSETGINGFHFVDEAAPPKMLKAMAEELILRKINITWWTNIRFEKTFNDELCELLAKSGCIAVTGGLEVASDRLLLKMKKGVDIAQVARVTSSFSKFNVMVHAYLMYGFPTETEQETVDSLEIVRQLFENNCIQSAFWHQFTTTIHSPIGQNPEAFDIKITGPKFKGFAQNDLTHKDPTGAQHQLYTKGLNGALNSYLNGKDFDIELEDWFGFEVAGTSLEKDLIKTFIS